MSAPDSSIASSKYLPCLLTRLTDDNPFSREDVDYKANFSIERLKKDVLLNLSMLLNSPVAPAETLRLKNEFPNVASSGYHFGIDSYAGLTDLTANREHVAMSVRDALIRFEPRFRPESITVSIEPGNKGRDKTSLDLSISCILDVHPLSEDIFFRLHVDVETGNITLNT